jgi:hypothetical protein
MKNLEFENEIEIYGYWDYNLQQFFPYWDSRCRTLNALYGKDTNKVYAI